MKKLNINELPEFTLINGDGYIFNTNELKEIKAVETKYKIRQSIAKLVAHFVKYKLTEWLERIDKIKALGNTIRLERYTLMMGEIEGRKKWSLISNKKKDSQTEESYILKHGVVKGSEIWNEMNTKRGVSAFSIDYWIGKGLTEKEAIEKISNLSKKGSLVGNKVQEDLRKTNYIEWAKKMPNTTHYWIEQGYDVDEAQIKVSERQSTFSKKLCIEKLGDIAGLKRWEERQEKWKNSIYTKDQNGFIKNKMNLWSAGKASKASLAIFKSAMVFLDTNGITYHVGVEGNNEFCIQANNRTYMYDFTIVSLGLIFEFNGEAFHPNPKWKTENIDKWNNWKQPYNEKYNAESKYKFDCIKNNVARTFKNFDVVELWSSDTVEFNKSQVMDTISEKLKQI